MVSSPLTDRNTRTVKRELSHHVTRASQAQTVRGTPPRLLLSSCLCWRSLPDASETDTDELCSCLNPAAADSALQGLFYLIQTWNYAQASCT